MAVPRLVVFDLDQCCWHPEMFELSGAPTKWDASDNAVICGRDRVKLFDGAILALRELRNKPEFKDTKVAAASSTTEGDWARKCLSLLEVEPGVKMKDVFGFFEIYPSNKTKHFKALQASTGVEFKDMLFFDDCTYGNNCEDVERGCHGVTTVRTPDGMTEAKWREGLSKFASQSGR
jgi:magnesium-dependent phosphatase 1